jgi:DnaJ homolog subfamily A member 5
VARFNGRVQFTDAPSGFFGGLRETFENLAREEELACEWEGLDAVDYPPFGHADDGFEEVVKPFYAVWNGFATRKTFSWKDIYRYSEAPDRRVRRIMEKENKRLRDEGIREFNDAVRSLIAFIRKRDPRYKANSQSEAERQKVLRDAAQAQAARSRAANQAKLAGDQALPDWAKTDGPQEDLSSEEESEQEEFECVVCNKTFKSEQQYQAHERSKKHVKAVKLLRHEMKKENRILDLEDDESSIPMTPEPEAEEDQPKVEGNDAILNPRDEARGISSTGSDEAEEDSTPDQLGHRDASSLLPSEQNDCGYPPPSDFSDDDHQDLDEDYAPREEIAHRMTNAADNDLSDRLATFTLDNNSDATPKKMGKAKQKRAKKAARKSVPGEAGSELKCAACQTGFPSKTRLFKHIKKLGHAQPAMTGSGAKKAKGPGKQDAGEG